MPPSARYPRAIKYPGQAKGHLEGDRTLATTTRPRGDPPDPKLPRPARQLGQEYQHGSTVRQLGVNASSVQKHTSPKPFLVSDQNAEGRVGRHLPPGNTALRDRYEHSFMTIGSLIYGDKKLALSALYIN
ncbi:hypothetical protein AAC387_Pa06g0084 [Persea americana]